MKKIFKLLLIFTLLILVYGCETSTTTTVSYLDLSYSDFVGQFIEEADQQLTMPEDDYYIYFYGPRCGACETIKPQVLDTFYRAKNSVIYIVIVESYADLNINTGVNGTPTIIRVIDGEVEEFYEGVTKISEMLDQIS